MWISPVLIFESKSFSLIKSLISFLASFRRCDGNPLIAFLTSVCLAPIYLCLNNFFKMAFLIDIL